MTSQHADGVVLATGQVREVAVGVGAVAFIVVAEAAPGVHSVERGTPGRVPCYHGDTRLTVHSCREVGGNTWSWCTEVEYFSSGFSATVKTS